MRDAQSAALRDLSGPPGHKCVVIADAKKTGQLSNFYSHQINIFSSPKNKQDFSDDKFYIISQGILHLLLY